MFKKNTIVLIPFPFTDLTAIKVRPAVIVSGCKTDDDIIVSFISSKKTKRLHKMDVKIQSKDKNFKQTGLKTDSLIKVGKLATLSKKIVLGELGNVSESTGKEINKKLKTLFGL